MHDPSFLAAEFLRLPVRDRLRTSEHHKGRPTPLISRRTNSDNLGERVYPWWTTEGYRPTVFGRVFRFTPIIEVWHDEPNDADMGTHCDYHPRGRGLRLNVWLWNHRHHLRWKIVPYIRVRCWMFDRCEDCGRRFRWRDARFGTGWDAPGVLHDECHRIRHLRGQVADLARYLRGEGDANVDFRVRYSWLNDDGKAVPYFQDLKVGQPITTEQEPSSDSIGTGTTTYSVGKYQVGGNIPTAKQDPTS